MADQGFIIPKKIVVEPGAEKGLDSLVKVFRELTAVIKDIATVGKQSTKALNPKDGIKAVKALTREQIKAKEVAKELLKLKKAEANAQARNTVEVKKALKENARLDATRRRANKALKDEAELKRALQIKTQKEATTIKGLKTQLSGLVKLREVTNKNTKEGAKEFAELTKRIAGTEQKLKDYDTEIGRNQRNVGNYKSAVSGLKTELARLNKSAKTINRTTKKGAKEFADTKTKVGALKGELKALRKEQRRTNKSTARLGTGLKNMAAAAGLFLGVRAIFTFFKNQLGIIMRFEQSLANLASITLATKEEMKELSETAIEVGKSSIFTATEVVGLQTALAKLGFSTNQIKASTKAVSELAAATGEDLAKSAKVAASTLRAFNLPAKQMQRVVDVMALSFSKSALELESFAVAMRTVAPIANAFGFTIENTTALLAQLVDAGFDASMAGTSLRNILLNLADTNGALAKRLGGSIKSFDELVPALIKLRKEGIELNDALDITTRRSVTAFTKFLDAAEGADILNEALGNAAGTAKKMADVQLDTLQNKLVLLSSKWEAFVLSIEKGDGILAKVLRNAIEMTSDFLKLLTPEKVLTKLEQETEAFNSLIGDLTNDQLASQKQITQSLLTEFEERFKIATNAENLMASLRDGETLNKQADAIKQQQFSLDLLNAEIKSREGAIKTAKEEVKKQQALEDAAADKAAAERAKKEKKAREKKFREELEALQKHNKEKELEIIKTTDDEEEREKLLASNKIMLLADEMRLREKFVKDALAKKLKVEEKFGKDSLDVEIQLTLAREDFFKKYIEGVKKLSGEAAGEIEGDINDIAKQIEEATSAAIDSLTKALIKSSDRRKKIIDEDIRNTTKQQDALRVLAAQGVEDIDDNLAFEEKKRAELERKRKIEEQRKVVIQAGLAGLGLLQNYANQGDKRPLASTLTDIGKLLGFTSGLRLAEGTESVGRNGAPKGKDTIPAMLDEGERVMKASQNARIKKSMGNISNEQLTRVIETAPVNTPARFEMPEAFYKRMEGKIVEHKFEVSSLVNGLVEVIKTQNKTERNHYKQRML